MGKDAPVNQEAAGLVKGESLAAESYEESGEFVQNRNAQPEGVSSSGQSEGASGQKDTSFLEDAANLQKSGGRQQAKSAVAGAAPVKDTKRPHGKNIKEGISGDDKADAKKDKNKDSDGLQRALRAEPGSEDDPSRLAERRMLQGNSMSAGGAGPRQSEISGETRYDVLKNEVDS